MNLSDLVQYAQNKYQIQEEYKWPEYPGSSVLINPKTGKWVALLMRQWDSESGTEIERCDIKCGQYNIYRFKRPYLSYPFRMHGFGWLGVCIGNRTDPGLVFFLFDSAIKQDNKKNAIQRGSSFIPAPSSNTPPKTYQDTPIAPNTTYQSTPIIPDSAYQDTALPKQNDLLQWRKTQEIKSNAPPDKIRQMMRLYDKKDGTFLKKCKNFYTQGMFMQDYEDDAPWNGILKFYFPTYHDLNVEQLRGYFTWRTSVRKGSYPFICTSLAYIYIYELLNQIGTESPLDSLKRMKDFEIGFLDSGIGEESMRKQLHQWMLEFSVIHRMPLETVLQYTDSDLLGNDQALDILKNPTEHSDEEIFVALSRMSGNKLTSSAAVSKDAAEAKHLFAEFWKYLSQNYFQKEKDIFTSCFGRCIASKWFPLGNAVYWDKSQPETEEILRIVKPDIPLFTPKNTNQPYLAPETGSFEYVLNPCRKYTFKDGTWTEYAYQSIYCDQKRLASILHEADRQLRIYLKAGHTLRAKPEEAWVAPYIEAVIRADKQAKLEAAKPKININFSELDKIRNDACATRDSLLTQDELDEDQTDLNTEVETLDLPSETVDQTAPNTTDIEPASFNHNDIPPSIALDSIHLQILKMLLNDEPVNAFIASHHLMVSIVADTMNEALFDAIGDNVLECDGDSLTIIEDYREDVLLLVYPTLNY
ncbi:MAG: TerB N-terminal domain-containing protein [Proteobacteria bacterium]|nr:TerB N-terminal domain-containing protein [Pseudomonadota bacterium]